MGMSSEPVPERIPTRKAVVVLRFIALALIYAALAALVIGVASLFVDLPHGAWVAGAIPCIGLLCWGTYMVDEERNLTTDSADRRS